jgi:DnaJ-class molecular chaperone
MKTPYEILSVSLDATDAEIKHAYLLKVRTNPPDRNREQFQLIHNAYQSIKDAHSRVSYDLFTLPVADFNAWLDGALQIDQTLSLSPEQLNMLLQVGIGGSLIPTVLSSYKKP